MKKLLYIFAAAAALSAVSCVKEEFNESQDGATTFYGKALDVKTAVIDGHTVWTATDNIKVFYNGTSVEAELKTGENTSSATFEAAVGTATDYYAVYPASETASMTDDVMKVTLPATQDGSFGAGHVAVAKAADKTFTLTENKNDVDIVYNRTFGHTSWQVLYVPFAIPVVNMEGFEVYSISNVTDSGVVIEQVVEGDLSANTPYIIKATEAGGKTIKVTGATLSLPVAYEKTIGNFTINGTYSSMAIDAESQYVLTNGLWCQLSDEAVENGNNILGAFRVYLTANGENTPSEVRFVINNSDATAIDELKAENGNVKAEVYDLSGRRVEKAVKGIYVVNGVKVIK
jgi:hypothetical protein